MIYVTAYTSPSGRRMAFDHLDRETAIKHAERMARRGRSAKVWTEGGKLVASREPLPHGMVAIASAA